MVSYPLRKVLSNSKNTCRIRVVYPGVINLESDPDPTFKKKQDLDPTLEIPPGSGSDLLSTL